MSSKLEFPYTEMEVPDTEPDTGDGQIELATATEPPPQDTAYQRAKERAQAIQGLYIHLLVYGVINVGLFLINWATRGAEGAWWFRWPLLVWGVGLAVHIVTIFAPIFSPDWADRRAARMVGRGERHG